MDPVFRQLVITVVVAGLGMSVSCMRGGLDPLPEAIAEADARSDADAAFKRRDSRFLQVWYVWGAPRTPGLDSVCANGLAERERRGVRLVSDVVDTPKSASDSVKALKAKAREQAESLYVAQYNTHMAALTNRCATYGVLAP